jgi:hypothetical protein
VQNRQFEPLTKQINAALSEGDTVYGAACENCSGKTNGCQGLPVDYFEKNRDEAEAWLRPITQLPS